MSYFLNSINSNKNIKTAQNIIPGGPPIPFITIPNYITVHLGQPNADDENITVPFIDYIKNVASSELYPTWPENALRANIHAIVSIALNRTYTGWYRNKGYNFDITNSTQYDQAYVQNKGIYDNVDKITDEIFNDYIVINETVEPLFAEFCDGRISQCDGMYQWGSVDLANQGYTPLEILKYYYGNDISIVTNAPVSDVEGNYPGEPVKLGDSSIAVLRMQLSLQRISRNFPAITKIDPINGYFGESTEAAVREFQRIFNLPVTGIVDQGTWYKMRSIYTAVTKVAELSSEGTILQQVLEKTSGVLLEGDTRPRVGLLQYFLNLLSTYYETISEVKITYIFDEQTRDSVIEFQKAMGLPKTGIVDEETWDVMYKTILGIFKTLPAEFVYLPEFRYANFDYRKGYGTDYPGVFIVQAILSYISSVEPSIPKVEINGIFDDAMEQSVIAFQKMFGLEPTGIVDAITWNALLQIYRERRYSGVT
ncbi:MAG: putative peptidoglycan-binding protein [Bacillota bacterium]|nr:putative peptidoglycan-binding protein [Bacillota bacterium]